MPAAMSISTSFLTKMGAGGLSELAPIRHALCFILLIESRTVEMRGTSRMTLGPTTKNPKKMVTTLCQEMQGNM
jgi:hypothetical protein